MDVTRKIPELEGSRFLGNLPEFKQAPHEFLANHAVPDHSLLGFRILKRKMIGVVGTDCAEHIFKSNSQNYPRGKQRKPMESLLGLGLVNLEGEDWKNHRRMVALMGMCLMAGVVMHRVLVHRVFVIGMQCMRHATSPWITQDSEC